MRPSWVCAAPLALALACGSSGGSGGGDPDAGSSGSSGSSGSNEATPITMATGLNSPCAIAADEGGAVWMEARTGSGAKTGTIRAQSDAESAPKTIASVRFGGPDLVMNASDVYFAGGLATDEYGVVRVPRAGGAPSLFVNARMLPTEANVTALALGPADLFFNDSTSPGGVFRAPLAGGMPTEIATARFAVDVAFAGNAVTFLARESELDPKKSALARVDLATRKVEVLDTFQYGAGQVVTDGTQTYYTSSFALGSFPRPESGASNFASAKTFEGGLAMDVASVYIGADGQLQRVARATGQKSVLATSPACGIALAKGQIYWTARGTEGASDGAVYRMPLPK